MKISAVAKTLNVSQPHVYALIDRGALPAIMVGASKRVDPADLRRYIDANRTVPSTAVAS